MVRDTEDMLRSGAGIVGPEFEKLKDAVGKCYTAAVGDGAEKHFCHCDTYAPNWMLTEDQTILIDRESAGNSVFVWALCREACGVVMTESLYNRRIMAKRYSRYLAEKYGL